MKRIFLIVLVVAIAGCANFEEQHYFTSATTTDERATNYFRLRVRGGAQLSSARYVAGFYDERAVDLFFSEMKTADTSSQLFVEGQKSPGGGEIIRPLDPSKTGAFVMVLSTNAQAIANTIGNFAESSVTAQAITNLVSQSELREIQRANSQLQVQQNRAAAVAGRIGGLLAQLPDDGSRIESEEIYLRILNVIGEAVGARQNFRTIEEASEWLDAFQDVAGG